MSFVPPTGIGQAGFFDDFISMTDATVADGVAGNMKWDHTTIGNAGSTTPVDGQSNGVLRLLTAGTAAGDGDALHGNTDAVNFRAEGGFGFRFRYPTLAGNALANNNIRAGIDDSVTATDAAVGIFVKSLAGVMELQAESTNGDVRATASGVPTLTSGTTAVINTWHEVDVKWDGENVSSGPKYVTMYIDGWEAAKIEDCLIGNAETAEYKFVHWQSSTGAETLEVDLDYFYAWHARQ